MNKILKSAALAAALFGTATMLAACGEDEADNSAEATMEQPADADAMGMDGQAADEAAPTMGEQMEGMASDAMDSVGEAADQLVEDATEAYENVEEGVEEAADGEWNVEEGNAPEYPTDPENR